MTRRHKCCLSFSHVRLIFVQKNIFLKFSGCTLYSGVLYSSEIVVPVPENKNQGFRLSVRIILLKNPSILFIHSFSF